MDARSASLNGRLSVTDVVVDFRCCVFVALQVIILLAQNACLPYSEEGMYIWCQKCFIFILANVTLQVLAFQKIGRLVSLGSLFILCSYLVNCSFCILVALDAQDSNSAFALVQLPRFGQDAFIEATRYALNCIGSVAMGYYCLSAFSIRRGRPKRINSLSETSDTYLILGKLFSVVFGAIYFASTAVMVASSIRVGNYSINSETMSLPFMNDAINLHPFYFAGLFLLMVHYKKIGKLRVSKYLMMFAVACIVLSFFSGARSRGTMQLLVLLVLWVCCIDRPKLKTVLFSIVLCIVLLQLMAAIRIARSGELSVLSVAEAFFSLDNSLIYEVLNEYGLSLFSTAGLMNWVDELHPLDFVLRQVGSILPGASSWGGEALLTPTVRTGFEATYHLGSTYIADIYYYFGSYGPLAAAGLGLWIALLDKFIEARSLAGDYFAVAVAMPGVLAVFNSARASIDLGIKMFLYSALIFYIAFLVIKNERRKTKDGA